MEVLADSFNLTGDQTVVAHRGISVQGGQVIPNSMDGALHFTGTTVEFDANLTFVDGDPDHEGALFAAHAADYQAKQHQIEDPEQGTYTQAPLVADFMRSALANNNNIRAEIKGSSVNRAVDTGESLSVISAELDPDQDRILPISFSFEALDLYRIYFADITGSNNPADVRAGFMMPSQPGRPDDMDISKPLYAHMYDAGLRHNPDPEIDQGWNREWILNGARLAYDNEFTELGVFFGPIAVHPDMVELIQDDIGITLAVFGCNKQEAAQDILDLGVKVVTTENIVPEPV